MWLLDSNALIKIAKHSKKKYIKKEQCFTTIFNIIEFPPALNYRDLTIFFPTQENYQDSLVLATNLRKAGTGIKAIDILIAIIAIERDMKVVTDDEDFKIIQTVDKRLNLMNFEDYCNQINDDGKKISNSESE